MNVVFIKLGSIIGKTLGDVENSPKIAFDATRDTQNDMMGVRNVNVLVDRN